MIRVGLISLGCAKNLVDSEVMCGYLHRAGITLTPDAAEADVLIVNTCAFIDAAKEESVRAILEAHRERGLSRRRQGQKLIVAGCLAQRFQKELPSLLPEVDAFIGLDQLADVPVLVKRLAGTPRTENAPSETHFTRRSTYIPDWDTPRLRLTPPHLAYVKIAEGCNHPCTFCIIPKIRGGHRSRTTHSVVEEARHLVAQGVRELNLISQDTTYFGMDRWESRPHPRSPVDSTRGESLAGLLRELQSIEGDFWIRLLYTHPAHWSDELIETIAACPKVARYVDMPLQHIADGVLHRMRRETDGKHIRELVRRIRAGIPGVAIRTTFIVGFPGETEAEFEELLDFIRTTRFERLGVFRYSQEEGTPAARFDGQLADAVKEERLHRAMTLQQANAFALAAAAAGTTRRVLVDAPGLARSEADAPDIDGVVHVSPDLPVGRFAIVRIAAGEGYDLVARGGRAPSGPRSSHRLHT